MPHSKQARKRLRQNVVRREANKAVRSAMRSAMKKILEVSASGDLEGARKLLPTTMQRIDKAAKKGIIHANTAARKKSRVCRAVRQLELKGAGSPAA
jgi:small subunit ribosomal protein S20